MNLEAKGLNQLLHVLDLVSHKPTHLLRCAAATMLPFSVNFATSSGVRAAITNSRFSLSTITVGVPAGAKTPAQSATLCAPSPTSIKVGMSGSAGSRVSASTASARSFLASIFDRALLKE